MENEVILGIDVSGKENDATTRIGSVVTSQEKITVAIKYFASCNNMML